MHFLHTDLTVHKYLSTSPSIQSNYDQLIQASHDCTEELYNCRKSILKVQIVNICRTIIPLTLSTEHFCNPLGKTFH